MIGARSDYDAGKASGITGGRSRGVAAHPRVATFQRQRAQSALSDLCRRARPRRPERVKAYTIATEVFGRDAKFDPQLDSIVRIEAGRLRRALERCYLTDGRASHLRIDIPSGGYVPLFIAAEPVDVPKASRGPPRGARSSLRGARPCRRGPSSRAWCPTGPLGRRPDEIDRGGDAGGGRRRPLRRRPQPRAGRVPHRGMGPAGPGRAPRRPLAPQ